MLQLKDFYPIDRDFVKQKWDEIMNVPNNQWEMLDVDENIKVINEPLFPNTLRTFQLNILPAIVIEILKNKE